MLHKRGFLGAYLLITFTLTCQHGQLVGVGSDRLNKKAMGLDRSTDCFFLNKFKMLTICVSNYIWFKLNTIYELVTRNYINIKMHTPARKLNHPLKCVQWVVLLGRAFGRMFVGSPQFLFVS